MKEKSGPKSICFVVEVFLNDEKMINIWLEFAAGSHIARMNQVRLKDGKKFSVDLLYNLLRNKQKFNKIQMIQKSSVSWRMNWSV